MRYVDEIAKRAEMNSVLQMLIMDSVTVKLLIL